MGKTVQISTSSLRNGYSAYRRRNGSIYANSLDTPAGKLLP